MMMEMARTHNSMPVNRGYRIFFIIIFLMPRDRNFVRYFCLYRDRRCMVCRIDVLLYIRGLYTKLGLPKQVGGGTGAVSCGDEALAERADVERLTWSPRKKTSMESRWAGDPKETIRMVAAVLRERRALIRLYSGKEPTSRPASHGGDVPGAVHRPPVIGRNRTAVPKPEQSMPFVE
jgi:hypothetical protein